MPASKHVLDLREIARRKEQSQTTSDSVSKAPTGVPDFDIAPDSDEYYIESSLETIETEEEEEIFASRPTDLFDDYSFKEASSDRNAFRKAFDQISEEHDMSNFFADKLHHVDERAARNNLFNEPVGEERLKASRHKLNVESGFFADLQFSVKTFIKRLRGKNETGVNFHQTSVSGTPVISKKPGLVYQLVSLFGRLIEFIGLMLLWILRMIRMVIFSPITFLDYVLEGVGYLLKQFFRVLWRGMIQTLRFFSHLLQNFEFQPPYFWYKKVGSFALIAVLVILPIKLFFEVPKFLSAKQEVLGISTKALSYVGLFSELREYVPAAVVAKEFAGFNGPRRYLLIFQNNAELRATGGFMGSYALVDVDSGKIEKMEIPTGGFYDLKGYITRRVEAPKPFHVFSPYWQIWNANWFADFPTSARTIAEFYENSTGPTVDGVVMITPNIVEDILAVTGPIELPEYDVIITEDNFRSKTQVEVELEYDKEANTPKAFIGALAPELISRVFTLIDEGRTKELLSIIDVALEEKQLLMYSTTDSVQKTISELNWGGELRTVPQDYLQIVHTNIGGGKTDLVIKDTIRQEIKVRADGGIVNEVSITRNHTGDTDDIFEGHDNLDYMRFYVPRGSRLLSATGFTQDDLSDRFETTEEPLEQYALLESLKNNRTDLHSNTDIFEEGGKTVFGNWLGLKPGQTKTVTIRYELPFTLDSGDVYHIYWQKQSGTQGAPLTVSIDLLDDKQFVNWFPQDSHITLSKENTLFYSNDLRSDRYLSFSLE